MALEGRTPSRCNPEDDSRRVRDFSSKMLERWQKGREQYGATMRLDPFEEAKQECLDLANYSLEIYFRIEKLKEKVYGLANKTGD